MNFKILNRHEKQEILGKLNEQFGIEELPFQLILVGSDRLVVFSGELDDKDIEKLEYSIRLEGIGLYLGKIDDKTGRIRLSIEGSQLLANQITKNTFELDETQTEEWMKGHELPIASGQKDFLIMKYKDNFLGSGKASQDKIGNFIPKERRLKEKTA